MYIYIYIKHNAELPRKQYDNIEMCVQQNFKTYTGCFWRHMQKQVIMVSSIGLC